MNEIFYTKIANSTAHRASREQNTAYLFENPGLFSDLFSLATNLKDKNHHRACWVMELVLEQKLDFIFPHTNIFCETINKFTNDSAIRPVSKIVLFLVTHNHKKQPVLSQDNLQKITETCFDWLINDMKVASKAYAIQTLYLIGKTEAWVYPELKQILSQDFPNHTPAYKSVAKRILKKI